MTNVLLLNSDWSPVRIISWQRAICLLLADKVMMVSTYPGQVVRSASISIDRPAVVSLTRFAKNRAKIKFNRSHVLSRDGWTCQYCGVQPRTNATLTLDHVVPRSHAVRGKVTLPWNGQKVPVTGWSNVVTACERCNRLKADRVPTDAGMKLATLPTKPGPWDALRIHIGRRPVPEEWADFLPK